MNSRSSTEPVRTQHTGTKLDGARGRMSVAALLMVAALATLAALAAAQLRRDTAPAVPDPSGRMAPMVVDGSCPTPVYMAASGAHKEGGVVMLNFLVGADGAVVDSKVETSSGHPMLDESARLALSRCRFHPGTLNGQPEESWHIMKYDWGPAR